MPGKFISISLSCAKSLLNTLFAAGTQKICRVSAGYRLELVLPGGLFGKKQYYATAYFVYTLEYGVYG
ncbi:MAG: hypothetical protein BA873_01405 [Desulfobulbaceae bacterium C00003063]|nr:MAG: hypothetical protein BA873_01405 [Desulfobulbaceae bacterium C00003063]